MLKKIPAIIGPTCSAKTSLAIKLAKLIDCEIIGLDSRQIYKYMPIGTAQPSEAELIDVAHHLIGFRDPWHSISAGEYSKMVFEKVHKIKMKESTRGKVDAEQGADADFDFIVTLYLVELT